MLLLVYTVVTAHEVGWGSARTIGSFAVVAVLGAAFLLIESRTAHPLVRLGIFRNGDGGPGQRRGFHRDGFLRGFQFIVTLYLQRLLGWSALEMALAFLPAGALVALSATRMGAIVDRFGPARVTVGAFIALVAGYVVFLRVGVSPDYPSVILPAVVLIGVAFGLGFSALSLAATAGIPDDEQGLAASLFQTSFQVGGAIVLAIVTAVVEAGGASQITTAQATLGAYRPGDGRHHRDLRHRGADRAERTAAGPAAGRGHGHRARRGVGSGLGLGAGAGAGHAGGAAGRARSVGRMKVRIGLSLGAAGAPAQFEAAVALLEAAGVDSLWLPENVYGPAVEPFTGMTFALAKTTRLKVGQRDLGAAGPPPGAGREAARLARRAGTGPGAAGVRPAAGPARRAGAVPGAGRAARRGLRRGARRCCG